jgi:hypothetical protein
MKANDYLKMFTVISTIIILVSCQNNEVFTEQLTTPTLKSAGTSGNTCIPQSYGLLVKQQIRIGEMIVVNTNDYLMIEVIPEENICINNVNVWVGSSMKKVNDKNDELPSPSKSGGYSTSTNDLNVTIPLNEIDHKNQDGGCETKDIYIIAHITATISTSAGSEEVSAWSEGNSLGNSQNVTYSTYTTCCRSTGEIKCFPHKAQGGNHYQNGIYYYDANAGGPQNIYADNGSVAGSIKLESGIFTFSFDQDWMFSGDQPLIDIKGYDEPEGENTSFFTGEPSFYQGIYSVSVPTSAYFQINFQLQNCYLVKP